MHYINVQLAAGDTYIPKRSLLRKWAKCALDRKIKSAEITIRVVDDKEMTELNETYRQKNGPTNVLSFPFVMPEVVEIDVPILGDIVVCANVVNHEAEQQKKSQESHWAHMIIHGVFHLLGYDHVEDREAIIMESLEIEIMQHFGYENPYETGDDEIND